MKKNIFLFQIAAIVYLATSIAHAANRYVLTNLGDLPGGDDQSMASDINEWGQVVGSSTLGPEFNAFLWTPTKRNGTTGAMVELGVLDGFKSSYAHGINDNGQVVGHSWFPRTAAFLWTPTVPNGTSGSMTDLGDPPHSVWSSAYSINSYGQITGDRHDAAFLWDPTSPNGQSGIRSEPAELANRFERRYGRDINSYGQIVGVGLINGTQFSAFLWTPNSPQSEDGSLVDLRSLPSSFVTAINERGSVVGWTGTPMVERAFLWSPASPNGTTGSMVDLGTLSGLTTSVPKDINSHGQIVGESGASQTEVRAFVWTPSSISSDHGIMTDLNDLLDPQTRLEWTLQTARGINDHGQIVGFGFYDPDGPGDAIAVLRAYLLSPIPEPQSSLILVVALLLTDLRNPKNRQSQPPDCA